MYQSIQQPFTVKVLRGYVSFLSVVLCAIDFVASECHDSEGKTITMDKKWLSVGRTAEKRGKGRKARER